MPIIVGCPQCRGQLRVADDLIGRKVRCPACNHTFEAWTDEPDASPPPVPPFPHPPASPPPAPVDLPLERPIETATLDPWKHLNLELTPEPPAPPPPPVEGPALVGAVEIDSSSVPPPAGPPREEPPPTEGRRRPRLNDEHDDLRPCPECRRMVHHGARRCSFCGVRFGRYDDEDYDDRRYPRRGGPRRDCDPHRAGLVLTLGILSLTLPFLCWLAWFAVLPAGLACGITAWILGHNDLRRMREGSMDPDGESSTHGGWVCGIIGTCLSGLLLLSCGSLMGTLYYAGSLPWQQQNQPFRAPPGPRR